jgi:NAD(P)H dehydrogenase (quinone)
MTTVPDKDRFHIQAEQTEATRQKTFAPDIPREHERVAEADNVILQFLLWWRCPPAILKGWIDHVLVYGFGYVDGRRFDNGLFLERRAMLSVTTGGTANRFADEGVYGPIGSIFTALQKLALEYVGFDVALAYVAHGAPRSDNAERRAHHLVPFSNAALGAAPEAGWSHPNVCTQKGYKI